MRTALAATAAFALLTACQPQDPTGAPAEAPADAPPPEAAPAPVSDFSQPMTARGNEPFWAVVLDGTTLTLKRPGVADVAFEAPGAAIQPGQAVWQAKGPKGEPLTLKLYVSECSDGMSDTVYPMTAEVEMTAETLRGCAAKTAELPKGQ
jgi:uncharacterized membrane protein